MNYLRSPGTRYVARHPSTDLHIRCESHYRARGALANYYSIQRGHKQSVSQFSAFFIALTSIGVAVGTVVAAFKGLLWLDLLYYLSYLKLVISFWKFVPQAWLNYKRKSTIGWSIHNILLVSILFAWCKVKHLLTSVIGLYRRTVFLVSR